MKLLDKCNELGILAKNTFYINLGWGDIQVEDHLDGEFSLTMPLYYFATSFLHVIPIMTKCDKRLSVLDGYSVDLPKDFDNPDVKTVTITKYDSNEELRISCLELNECTVFDQIAIEMNNYFEPVDDDDDDDDDDDENEVEKKIKYLENNEEQKQNDNSIRKVSLTVPDEDTNTDPIINSGEYKLSCMKIVTIYVLRKDTIKTNFETKK